MSKIPATSPTPLPSTRSSSTQAPDSRSLNPNNSSNVAQSRSSNIPATTSETSTRSNEASVLISTVDASNPTTNNSSTTFSQYNRNGRLNNGTPSALSSHHSAPAASNDTPPQQEEGTCIKIRVSDLHPLIQQYIYNIKNEIDDTDKRWKRTLEDPENVTIDYIGEVKQVIEEIHKITVSGDSEISIEIMKLLVPYLLSEDQDIINAIADITQAQVDNGYYNIQELPTVLRRLIQG